MSNGVRHNHLTCENMVNNCQHSCVDRTDHTTFCYNNCSITNINHKNLHSFPFTIAHKETSNQNASNFCRQTAAHIQSVTYYVTSEVSHSSECYGHIHLWHDALLCYWSWVPVFTILSCQWKQEAPLKWWHWPTKLHHPRCSYKHNFPLNFFTLKWPENLRAGKVNIFICNFHNVTIHISSYTQLTVSTQHVHLFLHQLYFL